MRIANNFSRKAIQLVATKRPPITFEVEERITHKKLRESRMYKFCMHPDKDNSLMYLLTIEVKQVLKGQNIGNVDAA
eukprot:2553506-Ditylum_brightwellii.AAC.1